MFDIDINLAYRYMTWYFIYIEVDISEKKINTG
jgi:hypothetical protein